MGRDRAGKLEINLLNSLSAQAENSNAAKFDRSLRALNIKINESQPVEFSPCH